VYQFRHKERKDDIANSFRRRRHVRDAIVFIGVAQEKAQAFNGKKVNGRFQFDRDKTGYVNHYYFYIDDEPGLPTADSSMQLWETVMGTWGVRLGVWTSCGEPRILVFDRNRIARLIFQKEHICVARTDSL
jgi:hypothetical protein